MRFEELQLAPPILKALAQCGHHTPTPVQEQAIPEILAGNDLIASARTGNGKTAAFVLPALQRLSCDSSGREPGLRVLVITPTRELAGQITQVARTSGESGIAISFASRGEITYLPRIERYLGHKLSVLAIPARRQAQSGRTERKTESRSQKCTSGKWSERAHKFLWLTRHGRPKEVNEVN